MGLLWFDDSYVESLHLQRVDYVPHAWHINAKPCSCLRNRFVARRASHAHAGVADANLVDSFEALSGWIIPVGS